MGNSSVYSPNSGCPPIPWSNSAGSSNPIRKNLATRNLVVFRLADNWFGVDVARIERVVPADYLTRLTLPRFADGQWKGVWDPPAIANPKSKIQNAEAPFPDSVLGTVGLGDRLVPVVDLRSILGIGYSRPDTPGSVLVIRVPPRLDSRAGGTDEDGLWDSSFFVPRSSLSEIGILADEVEDVFFIPVRQIIHYHENSDSALARVIAGECICGGRVISLIDVAGVIETLRSPAVAIPA